MDDLCYFTHTTSTHVVKSEDTKFAVGLTGLLCAAAN